MSVSEVIGMNKYLFGGVAIAAFGTAGAAIAQTAPLAKSTPQTHARRSFFTSNEARTDVPAHVQRMFARLDLNRDGHITRDEVAASRAQFEAAMSKSAPKRASRLFNRLDANHDGQITQAEIDAERDARASRGGSTNTRHRAASSTLMGRADSNKDGVITRAEYDSAVAAGKVRVRHANMRGSAIARLFDAADVNKDGRVSLEEAQQAALRHFDVADTNHDGVLTPGERRQASRAERVKRSAG
jgi:Ca2+-binding EF-hand superfamily protein